MSNTKHRENVPEIVRLWSNIYTSTGTYLVGILLSWIISVLYMLLFTCLQVLSMKKQ